MIFQFINPRRFRQLADEINMPFRQLYNNKHLGRFADNHFILFKWKILPVAHEECITVVILSNLKDSYDTDIEILPVIRLF